MTRPSWTRRPRWLAPIAACLLTSPLLACQSTPKPPAVQLSSPTTVAAAISCPPPPQSALCSLPVQTWSSKDTLETAKGVIEFRAAQKAACPALYEGTTK